jgi:hypothetical protein
MKKIGIFLLLVMAVLTGCIRSPDYDAVVQIQTNEIAFLVDMTGDKTAEAGNSAIQMKDIPIGGYWVRNGRFDWEGYWRPEAKVVVVSQAPVRLDWDQGNNTKTVRMTSIESSGFIVPMTINAYIDSSTDAYKYLRAFKPVTNENTRWEKLSQKEWAPYIKESAQPLEVALNTVVFTKAIEALNVLFVQTPILKAEIASKIYIPAVFNGMKAEDLNQKMKDNELNIVFSEDVSSIKDWAKETYGITITAMAPMDGVIYDNQDVQRQIDALAAGVMKEKTLVQDLANAQAQQSIDITRARTDTLVAQQKAAQASALQVLQNIENSRMIAEAEAQAIKEGRYRPVPSTVVVQDLNMLGTLAPGTIDK